MDQTTAADQATTAQTDEAGATSATTTGADQAQQRTDDDAAIAAALDLAGSHPYMPEPLRSAWPALLRRAERRDAEHAELVATVAELRDQVRDLIAALTPSQG